MDRRITLLLSLLLGPAIEGLMAQAVQSTTSSAGAAAPNALMATATSDYKLGPQDKLTFQIEEDPVKTGPIETITVSALGDIQLPVSRGYDERIIVLAKGRTLKEIETEIKTKLEADFYKRATVHLRLVDQSRRVGQVLFYGMVRGTVELFPSEQKMLSAAIIQLGYNEFADLKKVKVHRIDPVTKESKTITVDVKEILKTNDRSKDVILQDGDRVEVLERGFVF